MIIKILARILWAYGFLKYFLGKRGIVSIFKTDIKTLPQKRKGSESKKIYFEDIPVEERPLFYDGSGNFSFVGSDGVLVFGNIYEKKNGKPKNKKINCVADPRDNIKFYWNEFQETPRNER